MIAKQNTGKNTRLLAIMVGVTAILLLPLIAMQFDTGVDWGPFDFLVMGILLYGTGLTCELVMRKVRNITHRIILCFIILVILFLTWAELAVGIFGSPFAGS